MTTAPAITEKEFLRQIRDLAELFGWRVYHPFLSIHSPRGWPDMAICRPPRLVLAELKTDKGKLSPSQAEWIDLLEHCPGVETYVWRPAEFNEITAVLR